MNCAKMTLRSTFSLVAIVTAGLALGAAGAIARSPGKIESAIRIAHTRYKDLKQGKNADYIPVLAHVDPDLYAIAVVTPDGKVHTAGDVDAEVSIQSISNVITMAIVLQESGPDAIAGKINVGETGAITATSMIRGSPAEMWKTIIDTSSALAGRRLEVDATVYDSESLADADNRESADREFAAGRIRKDPERIADLYTRQCSINVNAVDLATIAATLANHGKNPITGKQVIDASHVPALLARMTAAGLDDDSSNWLHRTGLPATSGVGGGILAVSPGKFGIAVVSPPLDDAGNSVRGQKAIADISRSLTRRN